MEQKNKRKVATEIIIFFISILIIGLIWVLFWGINEFNKYKVEKLEKNISMLSHNIDSIQSTFQHSKTFDEMITGKIPSEYLKQEEFNFDWLLFDEEEKLGIDVTTSTNLRHLYKFLTLSHYPLIKVSGVAPDAINNNKKQPLNNPTLTEFEKVIAQELGKKISQKKYLKEIYDFLLRNRNINCEFEEFASNIEGLPLPANHDLWLNHEIAKKNLEDNKIDLTVTKNKIHSDDNLNVFVKYISLIILITVYPVRFLILALLWAIRTLKK